MDLLNQLGSPQGRKFGVLTELTIDERYLINQWMVMTTRYGRQVGVLIGNVQYTLPQRFKNLKDEDVNEYNKKNIWMIYKGTKKFGNLNETPILEFVE